MKNATQCAKKLGTLLKKISPSAQEAPAHADPIEVILMSTMMWESTTDKAVAAVEKLSTGTLDYNDLRVTLTHELVELIGSRYPRAVERCERLRATLRDIYHREHAMSLDSLKDMGKRDIKRYVETLDGIVPYVANRLVLIAFDVHAVPVDARLLGHLIAAGAVDDDASVADTASWMTRQIKAGEALDTHLALQTWVDTQPASRSKTTKKSPAKKSTRRSTTRKAAGSKS